MNHVYCFIFDLKYSLFRVSTPQISMLFDKSLIAHEIIIIPEKCRTCKSELLKDIFQLLNKGATTLTLLLWRAFSTPYHGNHIGMETLFQIDKNTFICRKRIN